MRPERIGPFANAECGTRNAEWRKRLFRFSFRIPHSEFRISRVIGPQAVRRLHQDMRIRLRNAECEMRNEEKDASGFHSEFRIPHSEFPAAPSRLAKARHPRGRPLPNHPGAEEVS